MKLFIRAATAISPQNSFGTNEFPSEAIAHSGTRLRAVEPDYSRIIDAKFIRRMSRIIKMGVSTALDCLGKTGVQVPDAIITGTAYGCLEDTELFLTKMVENKEELLTPTAFIQSTHNTVGAQIALLLKCHQYNNTFVHQGHSFENALLDAMLLLKEEEARNVLVGAVDEMTNISHQILGRFGIYKHESVNSLELFHSKTKGTLAGEGAAFFLLKREEDDSNLAVLQAMHTFNRTDGKLSIKDQIRQFLQDHALTANDIDLVVMGYNGDHSGDAIYKDLEQSIFNHLPVCGFKHLCGEYPTATAFALWLSTKIISGKELPNWVIPSKTNSKKIRQILIYNHYQGTHHALFLLSAC